MIIFRKENYNESLKVNSDWKCQHTGWSGPSQLQLILEFAFGLYSDFFLTGDSCFESKPVNNATKDLFSH